jgi:hypothetical protein
MSIIAFAAAAAVNSNSNARAEERGHADLMELINEDLDAAQDDFTLSLVDRTRGRIATRAAEFDGVFGPLAASAGGVSEIAAAEIGVELTATVIASAEFDVAKQTANIENPFNPRLPMAPTIVAFVSEES